MQRLHGVSGRNDGPILSRAAGSGGRASCPQHRRSAGRCIHTARVATGQARAPASRVRLLPARHADGGRGAAGTTSAPGERTIRCQQTSLCRCGTYPRVRAAFNAAVKARSLIAKAPRHAPHPKRRKAVRHGAWRLHVPLASHSASNHSPRLARVNSVQTSVDTWANFDPEPIRRSAESSAPAVICRAT